MKNRKFFHRVFLAVSFLFVSMLFAGEPETDWDAFSVNLTKAIKAGHGGLQQSAMQRIILYADNLDTKDCVYTIGRKFCYSLDPAERRLALIALSKINTPKSMAYVYQGMLFEDNASVKNQCNCILNEYCIANSDITEEDFKLLVMDE